MKSSNKFCYLCAMKVSSSRDPSTGRYIQISDFKLFKVVLLKIKRQRKEFTECNVYRRMFQPGYDIFCDNHLRDAQVFWEVFGLFKKVLQKYNKFLSKTHVIGLLRDAYYFTERYELNIDFEFFTGVCSLCGSLNYCNHVLDIEEFHRLFKTGYRGDGQIDYIHSQIVWDVVRKKNELLLSELLEYGMIFLPPPANNVSDFVRYNAAIKYLL